MSSPTKEEIAQMQRDLKVAEAQNALPHLTDILAAMQDDKVQALASLCRERGLEIADPQLARSISGIGNILATGAASFSRAKTEAEALLSPTPAPSPAPTPSET